MRITCPSCRAVYDAPDEAFGPGGRVVECSGCGARWLQPAPEFAEAEVASGPAPSAIPGLAAAAGALRELERPEPAAEPASAVAQIADPAPAADTAPAPARKRADTGLPPAATPPAKPAASIGPAEIDARSLSAQLRGARSEPDEAPDEAPGRGGFAVGFVLALLLGAVAAGAYLERDRVAEMVPQAAGALDAYVAAVDEARRSVERGAEVAREALGPLAESIRGVLGL